MVRTRARSLVLLVLTFASAAGTTTLAAADDTEQKQHDKAAAVFRAARADIAAGNCAAAVPKLEESLAYEPSVGGHLSMADCYEQVDLVAAWRELQEAADLATSKNDPRASIARDRATGLEPKLSMMHFVYPPAQANAASAGVDVRVDGAAIKPLLLRRDMLATTPGTHEVVVAFPHKKPWRGQVVARSAGTTVDVAVVVEDEAAPTPDAMPSLTSRTALPSTPPLETERSAGSAQRTVALVAGGAGVLGVAAGAVFGIVALAKQADLRDACGGSVHKCDAPSGASSVTGPQSSARSAATVSTVAFIAGGALLGAGIVLYATAPSAHRNEVGVEVGAAGAPGWASLSIAGRFE